MFDLSTLLEFSRCHCVAICAGLIPANLLISIAVIGLIMFNGSLAGSRWLSIAGMVCGCLLIFHVASWWLIGVIAPATFILPALGLVCMAVNWTCVNHPTLINRWGRAIALYGWKASSV